MSKQDANTIFEYEYQPLQGDEIRLLHLLPGRQDDAIHVCLVHQPLILPIKSIEEPKQDIRDKIGRTLPPGWNIHRTPEGRWFSCNPWNVFPTLTYWFPPSPGPADSTPRENSLPSASKPYAPFEALSYAWGHPSRHHVAHVTSGFQDVEASPLTLKMTANLDTALRYLRYADEIRCLWVDAICINQDDIEERNHQVLRMHDIYSRAWRVIAWLGPPTIDSHVAIDTIDYLGHQIEVSEDRYRFPSSHAQETSWYLGRVKLPYTDLQWSALEAFFSRPYFARLWILQEVASAKDCSIMQCGHLSVSWYDFRRAVAALDTKTGVPSALAYQISLLRDVVYGFSGTALMDVFYVARQHECSDARDRVYAVSSFFGPQLLRLLQPSYETSAGKVYMDVFLKYCEITSRLDLIAKCIMQEDNAEMPSWVPDWRPFAGRSLFPGPGYRAAGLSRAYFQHDGKGILAVKGVNVGRIATVFEQAYDEEDSSLLTRLSELQEEFSVSEPYVTGEHMSDAWSATLLLGYTKERYPSSYFQALADWKSSISRALESHSLISEDGIGVRASIDNMRSNLSIMKLFRTEKGYIGSSHACVRPGDRLCVLLGLSVPLILRPLGQGFQVVGWTYVHGLMDAEALLGPMPSGWTVELLKTENRYEAQFRNSLDGESYRNDPRTQPMSNDWQKVQSNDPSDDPICVARFRNLKTGEEVHCDPRMTIESLEQRGVEFETFHLT